MAVLIFPDGSRHSVLAAVTSTQILKGQKCPEGTIDGDDALLSRAFSLHGVRLLTDRGYEYEVSIMLDGAGYSFTCTGP
jgi:hypothetical protein